MVSLLRREFLFFFSGPISYRLGNQRRLKYAPPPDLTSNTSKQYSTPVVQSAFVPQSVAAPTIFNPNQIGSPSQTYESVPTTQNYQSVPLTQSYQSVPATQNHQPVPSTQSYQSTISAQSYKSVSPIQSNQSIPSTEIEQPVSSTQDYQFVPLIQTTQPTQSHQSEPLTQSYNPVSLSQGNQPVQLTQSNQSAPLTQSYQSSTGSFQPISSTQNYQPNVSTQSSKSVSPTSSKQPTPSPQSYQSVSLTQTYQSVSSSQSSQPISSTQSHQLVPLTQSNQFIKPSVVTSSPSIQHSTPELSESNSQQESFRASPLTTGSIDPSRRIPQNQNPTSDGVSLSEKPRVSLSSSQPIFSEFPEPATPQNTPANVSFFGFDGYTSKRDSSRTPNLEKEANNRSDSILKQNVTRSTAEKKPTVTFGPVSAVQVSEKLEHLLAEQKDDLSAKPDRSEAEDQSVGSPIDVKSDDIGEHSDSSKVDALSDPAASQEASRSNLSHQESSIAHEKIDASRSDGVSPQQYFQTQYLPSSADFFADQTSNLNTFPEALNTFAPPASTFFNANVDSSTSSSLRNDLQQVPLTTSFVNHPRNPWDGNQASMVETCSSSTPSQQPPLFYNPAQFHTELHRHISTHQFYGSPVVNQTQGYFDNLPGLTKTQEIPEGIGSAFLPSVVMTTVPEPTGSATLSPVQMSINPLAGRTGTDSVPTSFQNLVRCVI